MLTIPTKLYKHCYVLGRLKEYLKLKKKKIERERENIIFVFLSQTNKKHDLECITKTDFFLYIFVLISNSHTDIKLKKHIISCSVINISAMPNLSDISLLELS